MPQEKFEQPPTLDERLVQLEQEVADLREEKQGWAEKERRWEEERQRLIKERDEREKDAITDNLTGVFNARGLDEMAKILLPRGGTGKRDQVIGMFDLDNFKQLNTNHGHLKANEVLKQAVQVLKGFVRESDVVGRFGGEEFVVIFTNATGENIKSRLFDQESGQWKMSITALVDGEEIHSSFSGGITEVKEDETVKDFQAILERADAAMRHAKESGKSQVADFEEDLPEPPTP